MMHSLNLLSLFLFSTLVHCAVVEYDWELTWVNANPDGRLERPVIGINHIFPNPEIHVNVGDRLIVHVKNSLGNESTSIHWHGIHQVVTNAMDGPTGAVQCPIIPGSSFTYDFMVSTTWPFAPIPLTGGTDEPKRHILVALPPWRADARRPTRCSYCA